MAGECPGWYALFLSVQKNADAYGEVVGGGLATTNTVTATATGGVASYSSAWTRISGSAFTISNASVATVSWSYSVAAPNDTTEVWRCTVTDSAAPAATATVDVTVQIVHSV